MVRQEIYGYLLTHHAMSALICRAATDADIDPDRVKFMRTVRIIRRQSPTRRPFPPDQPGQADPSPEIMADITEKKNLNPERRGPLLPPRCQTRPHNSYRVKKNRRRRCPPRTGRPPSHSRTSNEDSLIKIS